MSAGATISGQDGIIKIGGTNEVAMLTAWTFASKADIQTLSTRVMKSNSDGGSGAAGGYDKKIAGAKSATLEFTSMWQESDTAGAATDLRTDDVGKSISFSLYPNNSTSGKRVISGTAIISSVSVPSTVEGTITQTVQCEVDGAWSDTVVA